MKIEKGIKTLTEMLDIIYNAKSPERNSALRLGIEALKRVQAERIGYEKYAPDLLPGETE